MVTWTVTDVNGNTNTCTQNVTVNDTENPTITCPSDTVVGTDAGLCTYSGTIGTPVTNDNCGVLSVVASPVGPYPTGTTMVTWTVTDVNGNTNTCTQNITVNDVTPPTISCPSDVVVSTDAGLCTYSGTIGTPVTNDNCGVLTVIASPAGPYPTGTTMVTWTVTDVNGNTNTCTQNVTVNDTENPTISCPTDQVVNTGAGVCTAVVNGIAPTASGDNCSILSITYDITGATTASGNNDASGTTFNEGVSIVTYTITDGSTNTATCSFTVTVNDTENPTITCPSDTAVSTDAGLCTYSGTIGTPVTNDNCGVLSVIASPAGPYPTGTTMVTWTVTDVNGNTNTCTQNVTVNDTENPTITCPSDTVVGTDAGLCTYSGTIGTPVTNDNCGVLSVVASPAGPYPTGTTMVTWTV